MKTHPFPALALATVLMAASHSSAATMSASATAPAVNDADIANLGAETGTDKWFTGTDSSGAAKGQTFTTVGAAVRLKAITYRIAENQKAEPTKTYAIRLGKAAGTSFTTVHSETATQNFTWNAGEYMTWTFATPVMLEPYTTYGIDVGLLSSTSSWTTGIPYIEVTDDDYPGGGRYNSGASGTGTSTLTYNIGSDRVFHLDIERPLGAPFALAATSPLDNATDALANRNVVLTFSQNVTPGTGSLTIRNLTDNTQISLASNDNRLTYDQNVVRINPADLFTWSKNYAIRIDAGMFLGDGGAPIAAIGDDTTWNFTTLPGDPLLDAIAALKNHITANNLTGPEIAAHKTTIDNQRQRFSENATIIAAVFDLISSYSTAKGPLFVSGSFVTNFNRDITTLTDKRAVIPENFHWAIYTVMQYTMDVIYTADTLAAHEALLAGYKFGSHADFPGPCSPPANPLNTHTVSVNGSFPVTFGRNTQDWTKAARKPTGTYLAPGTIATVTVPPALVNAGYKVRVGAHSWDLAYRTPVERLERITRLYPINATTIKVANPNGGGIYIEVPIGSNAGVVSVTITGAVRSPYFSAKSFHQTTPTEWETAERVNPAPWADFQSDKFMIQVPRKWIYNMTGAQATQLMVDWDMAMDAINSLMGFDLNRGKETMYLQPDVILRSSVHAPGYPAVNVTTNPNNEVSPVGYAGSYLVRGPNVSLTAANIEFHEQGHAYGFPKFGGESESNVNLLQPAMLNRKFGRTFDQAQNGSFGGGNTFITMDTTAIAWMCVFSFSPNEIPMQQLEKQYQHKGHAKWMDVARLFGWEKLDAYWRSFMEDDANNIPYGTSDDDKLLRLSRHVGYDIRPLFHFWGIHPQNPAALAAAIAAENIPASTAIRDQLLHYKSIVPADNAAFRSFATSWWGRKPLISGAWEETDHAMQWDETLDADKGPDYANVRPNGSIYVEASATQIRDRVQELVDLYFPIGITPSQMAFAIAPSAVNSTTIGMTAVTATAANGPLQYFFENTTNSTNSGWISGTSWQQTGLAAGDYSYRVKARDGLNEETAWSEPVVASLTAAGDITPPSPDPMTFSTPPYAVDENTITMTATTATDVNGVEYEFENTLGGGGNSGWQTSPVFTNGNLSPITEYGYRVRARDSQGNITAWSAVATTNTADIPDVTAPQIVSLIPSGAFTDAAANLVVTFDEPVQVGIGNIILKNLTDGTQTQVAINDAARVSISGAVVTINPASDLLINKSYAIRITAGAVVDTSNNPFIGINDDVTWAFNVILADPLAVAGGPYDVVVGTPLLLNASGSLPSEGATITSYEWDLDNDGDYDEAVLGVTPATIAYSTLTGAPPAGFGMTSGTNPIQLRVTDSAAKTSTVQTSVNLLQLFTFDGANKSNGDNWNTATNWNPDAVPAGFAEVVIPAAKYVTSDNQNTPAYSGDLTIGAGATLQCGYSAANGWTYMNALGTAGSTTITMGAGSAIILRGNYTPAFPAVVLEGDVSFTIGTSTSGGTDPTFSKGISGPYTVYLEGKSDSFMTIDTTPNTFSGLVVRQVTASGLNINANVAGALGTGDVTIRANQNGVIAGNLTLAATDAIASTATLSLYGPASATKLKLTANNAVRRLVIDGVTQPAGTYGKIGSGAQHEVSWINSTSTATLTVAAAPSLYWDLNDTTAGAGSIAGEASGTWDSVGNLWNNADGDGIALPWTAGQQAVFSAGSDATGTYVVTVSGTHDIGGMDFKNGNVSLSGGGLRMTSDSEVNVGTGRTAHIATPISNDSARRLTKLGDGSLTLSGSNTYSGPTRIEQGMLSVATLANAGTDSPLGNFPTPGASGLILGGGMFQYTGGSTTVNRGLTLMGNTTLDIPTAGATLTLGDCETANQSGILTVTGGAGSVLAIGQARIVEAAQLTLNPTTATMIVGSANGYTSYNQSSILTLSGTSTGNIVSGAISQTNPPGSSFSQSIQVIKSGSGDWKLNGVSTYTGNTTVQAGNLIAGTNALNNANGAFGKQNNVDLSLGVANGNDDAGILTGGAFTIGRAIRLATANNTDTGTRMLTLGGNTAHASVFSGAIHLGTASNAGRGVTLTAASGGTVTFSGVIQNPTSMDATTYTVTKAGAGKVVLSNNNTYTGGTLVSEGTLEITGATQATSSITFNTGTKLGLAIATPVTAANAAVNLTNGQIAVTGTPSGPSHVLLTAQSITGTPVLAAAIAGYKLEIVGNQLQLNEDTATDPYTDWSGGAPADADSNNDGVPNGIAWALGASGPNVNATGLLPTINNNDPTYAIFTFQRGDDANADPNTAITVQYGNNLAGWTNAVDDNDNVEIEVNDGTPKDTVIVKLKRSTIGSAGKLFVRLNVVVAP